MPKRSSIKKDLNTLGHSIVQKAIDDGNYEQTLKPVNEKNPAAVALGRLGGIKGGTARAAKLSSETRKSIASKAAQARWGKKSENTESQ